MISGEQWRQRVPFNQENYRVLESGIARREQAAAVWVKQAQLRDLESGIASCISRGSDSLALAFPTDIAVTATLRQFMDHLVGQGFLVDVAFTEDVPGSSLLLIAPRP